MSSIRARLTIGLAAAACALWAGGALALYMTMRSALVAEFDAALESSARALAALTSEEGGRLELDFDPAVLPSFARAQGPDYFEMWLPDRTPAFRSPSLAGADLPRLQGGDRPGFADLTLPGGRAGRAVTLRFVPVTEDEPPPGAAPRQPVALVVARHRAELDGRLRVLATALLLVGAGTVLAAAALVPIVVGRGLRPLSRLAARASSIDAGALDVRFPSAGMPAELLPICGRLNELLARLEASFARERRFSADVAHELRTPIAELRSAAEVALRWPDDPAGGARALEDALEIALQMEAITTSLLALARCEAGLQPVQRMPVRMAEVLDASFRPWAAQAREKRLSLSFHVPEDVSCAADPSLLRLVINNLVSNAIEYCPRGGAIECRAEVSDGHCLMTVANTVEGLTAADLPHLFERFWRKDAARSAPGRSGLGLPLTKALAQAMRMDVGAELRGNDTLAVTLKAARA